MLTAIFADIHANRPAFEACRADAARRGATTFVLLGDLVGYGGDPDWVTQQAMDLVAEGALAIRGNHDAAIRDDTIAMNAEATAALHWTRRQLGRAERDFLATLPLTARRGDILYVHATADRPDAWGYIADAADAAQSLRATDAPIVVSGHIHRPAVYSMSATGTLTSFVPVDDVAIPLLAGRRWQIVCGAVGQPRDRRPAAAYTLLDPDRRTVTFCRVAYDIDAAADSIGANRLPAWLAERLFRGV